MTTETTTSADPNGPQGTVPPAGRVQDGPDTSRPGDGPEGTESGAQGAETESHDGNAEAGRYRRKLRDTERERDTLAERVTVLQRREIERVAGEHLAVGSDLLDLSGVEQSALCDDDGFPDRDKIRHASEALITSRPNLRRYQRPDRSAIGQGNAPAASTPDRTSWGDALRRK